MAKMIPNYIDPNDARLNGERMVFEWLSQDTIHGVAMHSLLQKNHRRKLIAEVDFLLITRKGLLCIEVKGGQEIYRKDGEWFSASKKQVQSNDPNHHKIKDPFRQSKDCAYALKEYLTETYGRYSEEANFLVGYAVVFPECKFTGSGNDLVTEVMFDCRYELADFPKFICETLTYWDNLQRNKQGIPVRSLNELQLQRLVDLLRGDFRVVPSLSLEIQHLDKQMLELTDEQYDTLDAASINPRLIIKGVAGTGKSVLALEKARQIIAQKKRVLYVCFNRNMAQYARNSLMGTDLHESFIGTYHSLLQTSLGRDDLYSKDFESLRELFFASVPNNDKYDYMIIDEAQDLMNANVWQVLDSFLFSGLSTGKWIIFIDPNQNLFNRSEAYDFAWDYMVETYNPFIFPLSQNCRNTEQIARRTAVMTLVPPAKHLKISGEKVIAKAYQTDNDLITMLKKEIMSLIAGGVKPGELVILSKKKLMNSSISKKTMLCGYEVCEISNISNMGKSSLNYFTIQSFKGLESKIVFLIDVDGFMSAQNRALNYVAMSRARILLYVYYQDSAKKEYQDVVDEGEDLLS